jgi:hypothetical protein
MIIEAIDFRMRRMPLHHGAGHRPVLGFGTLISDASATIAAPETRWTPDLDTSTLRSFRAQSARCHRSIKCSLICHKLAMHFEDQRALVARGTATFPKSKLSAIG